MKKYVLVIVAIFFLIGCSQPKERRMEEQLKEIVITDTIHNGLRKLGIKDTSLLKVILQIERSKYMENQGGYILLDYFHSPITGMYIIELHDLYIYDSASAKNVDSYIELDGKVFLTKRDTNLFSDSATYRKFAYNSEDDYWYSVGASTLFLIEYKQSQVMWSFYGYNEGEE